MQRKQVVKVGIRLASLSVMSSFRQKSPALPATYLKVRQSLSRKLPLPLRQTIKHPSSYLPSRARLEVGTRLVAAKMLFSIFRLL